MRRGAAVAAWLAALLLGATPGDAQQIRLTGASTLRYIELRPLVRDSVAAEDVPGSGLLRLQADGRTVRCVPDDPFCRFTAPGARTAAIPLLHDIEANGWGLGRGVHTHAQFRLRTPIGDRSSLWPQADDAFDVLAAWVELDRSRYRIRAGRQWQASGLGFYNFDGMSLEFLPAVPVRGTAWLGRSLVRGANEGRAGGALEAIEILAPDADGFIAGAAIRSRVGRLSLGSAYQVEFRGDGAGLFGERAAVDAAWDLRAVAADASVEVDVATASLNEARAGVRTAPWHGLVLHGEGRRYRPYFELWTIWGAFSPVGFDEARVGVTWTGTARHLLLRAETARRSYHDAGLSHGLDAYRGDGWTLGASGAWSPRPWRLHAGYRVDGGFGAARRDGHVGVRREVGTAAALDVHAVAFQRLYEFRVTEGTVYGMGAELNFRLNSRARVMAGGALYHHESRAGTASMDWNQRRGSVRVQWSAGSDAGGRP
jgi:hypothetical protein